MRFAINPLLAAILLVSVLALGYWVYQDYHKPNRVEINVGRSGISIESK